MKVVSNSSVLISLASIGRLQILRKVFKEIYIPQAVWNEVVTEGRGRPAADNVRNSDWIIVKESKNKEFISALNESLDKGEAEAVALTLELQGDFILLDEKDARIISDKYKIKPLGTVGILILAKNEKLIPSLKSELDKLINEGNFRLSGNIYEQALKLGNELKYYH